MPRLCPSPMSIHAAKRIVASLRRFRWAAIAACVLALAWSFSALALSFQNSAGKIAGTVRTESGGPLPGANVTLTDEKTSGSRFTMTAATGEFVFDPVAEGTYTVTASAAGFATASQTHISVAAGQTKDLSFVLQTADPVASKPPETGQAAESINNGPSYYDQDSLKPSAVQGAVDAGGYSTPGQARATTSMVRGVAGMKRRPVTSTSYGSEATDPSAAAITESELKGAVESSPKSFEANHNLGEFYVLTGKLEEGIPYLEKAGEINPTHFDNGVDLAEAYLEAANYSEARRQLREMIARQDKAELHNLLGEAEEGAGNPKAATIEFGRAARMDPSEANIFDWGSELLLHQSPGPAIKVFGDGAGRYPQSATLLMGLGVAQYARGRYDEAVKTLCAALDIAPSDRRPYVFLARMNNLAASNTEKISRRLERFVTLDPKDPVAHFDYAMSVWKAQRAKGGQIDFGQVEKLLKSALDADPKYPDAHFELGNLLFEQEKYREAISEYRQALDSQPGMLEAHYRLAQAFLRIGDSAQAQEEFELHDRLKKQQLATADKPRDEIREFVDASKSDPER